MEPVTLTADGLTLRPPRTGDTETIAKALADPEVQRWMIVSAQPEATAHEIVPRVLGEWRNDVCYRWYVADAATDEILGMVGLAKRAFDVVEIAYLAAPWARGRGVVEKAARVAIAWAFDVLKAPRVDWDAIVGNHLSRLLAVKLGFTLEGTKRSSLEQRGTRVDTWTGGMLPGELLGEGETPARYDVLRRRAVHFTGEQPVLDTELPELRLRPMEERDIDDITEASRDAETMAWTTVPDPYERVHAEGFLSIARAGWREGNTVYYVLADAGDRYCGVIDLGRHTFDAPVGEIGYSSAPWARGRGYMTGAVKAITRYGFDVLGYDRITWAAYVGNEGSRRVAEKAGFTIEGVSRASHLHRGERKDTWIGSILPPEA